MTQQVTYPEGYRSQRLVLPEQQARHTRLHPEFARRYWAFQAHMAGVLGVGSSWRTKPHPVSAASRAGHSFHQDQDFPSGTFCTAIDMVQTNPNGGDHIMVDYRIVPLQGSVLAREWGLHVNVSQPGKKGFESWHIQPIELDGFSLWVRNGRPDLFAGYPIPGTPPEEVPPPPPGLPPFVPERGEFSLWPLNKNKPRLATNDFVTERRNRGFDNWTDRGEAVRYLQGVILNKAGGRISVDGHYGPITEGRVLDMQRFFAKEEDGLVGPDSWSIVDFLAVA